MGKSNSTKPDRVLQYVEETISGDLYKCKVGKNERYYVIEGEWESGLSIYTATSDFGEAISPVKQGLSFQIDTRLYTTVRDGVLEETPESIATNPRETTRDEKFRYMMLDRMRCDCNYYLGYGNRNPERLCGDSVATHIEKMKELWNSFPDEGKPEWLTWGQIEQYEAEMKKGE